MVIYLTRTKQTIKSKVLWSSKVLMSWTKLIELYFEIYFWYKTKQTKSLLSKSIGRSLLGSYYSTSVYKVWSS